MTCTFYLFFFNDTATTEIYTLSLQRRSSDLYPSASYFAFLEARTDNVEERAYGIQNRMNEAMFFWEDFDQEDLDTPLNYWNSCYTGIAQVKDRKSTRLNSSHANISYAVFCLKKKKSQLNHAHYITNYTILLLQSKTIKNIRIR